MNQSSFRTAPSDITANSLVGTTFIRGGDDYSSVSSAASISSSSSVISNLSCSNYSISTRTCDFDRDATDLYKSIHEKKWTDTVRRAETHPEEVSTWIYRRERNNGKIRWKLLPLHAALIFAAPKFVIESLVDAYPEGVQCKDDQGMLPLHLAFKMNSPESIINVIVDAHPLAMVCKDRKMRTPLTLAFTEKAMNRNAFLRAIDVGLVSCLREVAEKERRSVINELDQKFEEDSKIVKEQHAEEMDELKNEYEKKIELFELKIEQEKKESEFWKESSSALKESLSVSDRKLELKLSSDYTAKLAQEKDEYISKIKNLEPRLDQLEKEKKTDTEELSQLRVEVAESKEKISTLEKSLQEKTTENNSLSSQIIELSSILSRISKEKTSDKSSQLTRDGIISRGNLCEAMNKLVSYGGLMDEMISQQRTVLDMAAKGKPLAEVLVDVTKMHEFFAKDVKERGDEIEKFILDQTRVVVSSVSASSSSSPTKNNTKKTSNATRDEAGAETETVAGPEINVRNVTDKMKHISRILAMSQSRESSVCDNIDDYIMESREEVDESVRE